MASERTDSVLSENAPNGDALRSAPSALLNSAAEDLACEKSWGDRFKHKAFSVLTYFNINYIVNAAGSAWLTYGVMGKWGSKFKDFSDRMGNLGHAKTGISAKLFGGGVMFVIKALSLTFVGNVLTPVIKFLEDRRHSIQFTFGHSLDKVQEMVGKGNSASKRNLRDYNAISQAMHDGNAATLSPQDLSRIAKKDFVVMNDKGKLEFKEHKLPWKAVIWSRFAAWSMAQVVNFGFGTTNDLKNKSLKYDTWEAQAAPRIETALVKIPGFTSWIKRPRDFANFMFNDFLLTISSSVTHKVTQGFLHKPEEAVEEEMKKIENWVEKETGDQPVPQTRRNIISRGTRDFRAQEMIREENRSEAFQAV